MIEILAAVASVTILEIVLSVDNALVNASLTEELPPVQRKKAIYVGIGLGAILRLAAISIASFIFKNIYLKALGAFYLCYLAYSHLVMTKKEEGELRKHPHFKRVIIEIALADIAFSIDNIIGAFGISPDIRIVIFGVLIGIVTMLFVTRFMLYLMQKFPTLERTAYIVIAFVGVMLLLEIFFDIHLSEIIRFVIIVSMLVVTIIYDIRKRGLAKLHI